MDKKSAGHEIRRVCLFVILLIAAVTAISCGFGEGTLTVTTFPVTGTVTVDGVSWGEAPITRTLSSGGHEIRFSDHTSQYREPGTRIVEVKNGKHKTVAGEYINLFIPREAPAGFSLPDSLHVFGTTDRPLKDGTIFDYINGGGVVYIKYGLTETTHAVYNDEYLNNITVDIFDMGTTAGAASVFGDEEVCPPGYEECGAVVNCKAYHYEPDYLMYFHKSQYLVYLSTTNDSLRTVVEAFGASIAANIP